MHWIIRDENGKSGIEWLLVMLLLVLFASGVFILSASTSDTYKRIQNSAEEDSNTRTAVSYIGTKIKQNDRIDGIEVVKRNDMDQSAVLIKEYLLGAVYETWIYFDDGYLREATIPENGKLDNNLSFVIAPLESFDVEKSSESSLRFRFKASGKPIRDYEIELKSGQGEIYEAANQ